MSVTSNPLWSTLDDFQVDLPSGGAHLAIGRLASSLAQRRDRAWPRRVEGIMRDARRPPRGLAAARGSVFSRRATEAGGLCRRCPHARLRLSARPRIAAGHVDRPRAVRREHRRADCRRRAGSVRGAGRRHHGRARHQTISVASIACGHARELDRIPEVSARGFTSGGSIRTRRASAIAGRASIRVQAAFEVGSVRDVLAGRVRIPCRISSTRRGSSTTSMSEPARCWSSACSPRLTLTAAQYSCRT